MRILKIAIFSLLITLALSQKELGKSGVQSVQQLKRNLSQISLIGSWKLTQESNFVINKNIEMINDQQNKRMRNNEKLSFITSTTSVRQAEGFFSSRKKGEQPTSLYIQMYDGKYYSNNTVALEIQLESTNPTLRTDGNINLWANNKSTIVVCMLIRDKQIIAKISVHAKYQIYTNARLNNLQDSSSNIFIQFQSKSISFFTELSQITNEYNSLATVQGISTLLFLFFNIIAKCRAKKSSAYNISEWMILQACSFALIVNIMFITITIEKIDTNLKFIGLCGVLNIILVLFFMANYEEMLRKAFKQWPQIIKGVLFVLSYSIICYSYLNSATFWVYESFCFLTLQMVYAYLKGGKGGLQMVLGATLFSMRLPFFYYLFYCPQITRQPINYNIFFTFLLINIVLIVFNIMQRYLGSRFIVPKELIPDYFNYYQKFNKEDPQLQQNCPICLLKLKKQDPQQKNTQYDSDEEEQVDQSSQVQQQTIANAGLPAQSQNIVMRMKAPCGHIYHRSCLQPWMDVRLQCPMDRSSLPPLERQRDDSYCC